MKQTCSRTGKFQKQGFNKRSVARPVTFRSNVLRVIDIEASVAAPFLSWLRSAKFTKVGQKFWLKQNFQEREIGVREIGQAKPWSYLTKIFRLILTNLGFLSEKRGHCAHSATQRLYQAPPVTSGIGVGYRVRVQVWECTWTWYGLWVKSGEQGTG